jgi:hypothetical protein
LIFSPNSRDSSKSSRLLLIIGFERGISVNLEGVTIVEGISVSVNLGGLTIVEGISVSDDLDSILPSFINFQLLFK